MLQETAQILLESRDPVADCQRFVARPERSRSASVVTGIRL